MRKNRLEILASRRFSQLVIADLLSNKIDETEPTYSESISRDRISELFREYVEVIEQEDQDPQFAVEILESNVVEDLRKERA